ncbi:MAG: transcription antitermination factor NusB [Treponema sp.]|nr:transcription antitermination factor NusB [Treponema sp.]
MRRIGRILAFQALYSWSVGGIEIDDLLDFSWIDRDQFEDEKKDNSNEEQVIGDNENPVPVNNIKYFLSDGLYQSFESFDADKKAEIFTFARFLIKGTIENIEQIDSLISSHLSEKWSLDRINKVALSVMRISVYEMLFQKTTAPSIVIDEAVEIVKSYGEDDSHKFTNAVLDKISKDLEK